MNQTATASRCALYARVSTRDQNCELQLRELRDYCQRRGFTIVGEYIDAGISGARASRPALDRLMRYAAEHRFQAVFCYKLDRFGRSVLNLSQSLALLDSYGVRFIAVSQGIDTDQSNPTSRLLMNILASVAAFELELIKERALLGVRAARAKGKHICRPRRVFRCENRISYQTSCRLLVKNLVCNSLKRDLLPFYHFYQEAQEGRDASAVVKKQGCLGKKVRRVRNNHNNDIISNDIYHLHRPNFLPKPLVISW
jgi:DNA invertase Pin-like site-specific DNA recombinase